MSSAPQTPMTPDASGRLPRLPSQTDAFADLYPERRGDAVEFSRWQVFTGKAKVNSDRRICEDAVIAAVETMPMVKTMLGALAAQGCAFDLDRHVVCDICKPGAAGAGGYDPEANQVFVCANNTRGHVHGLLVRSLVEMFDRCVGRVDFRRLDHLACMEVRKANLGACNFLNYMSLPGSNIAVRDQHADCVSKTAKRALAAGKFVTAEAASDAVDAVFDKCYADLEPYGRRARGMDDMRMGRGESYLFGYN